MSEPLVAPFPYFGGKRYAAQIVWDAIGNVRHYVEPFAGSAAVLLAREASPERTETINDIDGYITNVWRAIQHDPDRVAEYAAWPVSELDLTARHLWLVNEGKPDRGRLETDPDYFDAKAAGWWIWGASNWIGTGWCHGDGPWTVERLQGGDGDTGQGVHRKLPHLGNTGRGVHRQLPHLGDAGQGVHRKLPHLGDAGQGVHRKQLIAWFAALSDRLERVRICCGDWSRVVSDAVLFGAARSGPVAVFLDPPYCRSSGRHQEIYANETDVADAVAEWAFAHGNDPRLRIVLAGWDGDVALPSGWRAMEWSRPRGSGYANATGRNTQAMERLWLSPHCIHPQATAKPIPLFEVA